MKPATQWLLDIHDKKYFGKGLQVVIEDIQRDALEAAATAIKNSEFPFGFSDDYNKGVQWATNEDVRTIRALMPAGESLQSNHTQPAATADTANHTARTGQHE